MDTPTRPAGVDVRASVAPQFAAILDLPALEFIADLSRQFRPRRDDLLAERQARQRQLDQGHLPDFLPETADIRAGDWTVAPIPPDLQNRRVEITGPVDRKMVINALNSGANMYMADFEDAHAPFWDATLEGQANLFEAVRGTIEYMSPEGKRYTLAQKRATLLVRPRGWHLPEKHLWVDGAPIPAALFDFGLFLFHNAHALIDKGSGPYFYLPKLESHREARLWNDVFNYSEQKLALPHGAIKATVLIETILAAFEMDEILYELRDHCVGLNSGRWDYIFSYIKKFRHDASRVLPNRGEVTMTTPFMRAYALLLVKTCHRRHAFAMGGMAAQIPVKNDPQINEVAFARVRADKEREASDGYDGTWVAHPGLVGTAKDVFDRYLSGPNQLERQRDDVRVAAGELLAPPAGDITEEGLRNNVSVSVQYLAAWFSGHGSVPIYHLMEDAATAEISRSQIWQWIRHPRGTLVDGRRVTLTLFRQILAEELARIRAEMGESRYNAGHYERAGALLGRITASDEFIEFLTLLAYDEIP
jgi:malate synthase